MFDMSKNVDVYVCKPDSGINRALSIIFLQFELLDKRMMVGTGRPHTMAMTTSDAMWLLKQLEYMRKRFDLPMPAGDPVVDATPDRKN